MLVAAPAAADWNFTVTPYLWLPTINGTSRFNLPPGSGDGRFDVEFGPNDYLSNLQATAMVSGEARNGRTSFATDVIYLSFAGERSNVREVDIGGDRVPVNVNLNRTTESSFKGLAWTFVGGRSLVFTPTTTLDAILGVRYFGATAKADWQLNADVTGPGGGTTTFPRTGHVEDDVDLWDGIIGVRGRSKIGERWTVPYYFDIGGGSSALTWQAAVGITYSYHWGDVGAVYRHLAYDQKTDALLQNMSFSGPAINFGFHF